QRDYRRRACGHDAADHSVDRARFAQSGHPERRLSALGHDGGCEAWRTAARRGLAAGRKRTGMNAILALEDGTWFRGVSAGSPGETSGEVVFNTSMTGYKEVLTDPSYAGQIVTMTAPQIGNYGIAAADNESGSSQ